VTGIKRTVPVSIVVPAHDEEPVLQQFLTSLLDGSEPEEFEVLVVCNGCRDGSAAVARRFGRGVRVIETPIGDKRLALRLGDQAATRFPRFYIDADVRIGPSDIRAVARVLAAGECMVAAPSLCVDTTDASRFVRAYYRMWLLTPWVARNLVGSGVFALSEEGHERLGTFPEVGADDLWVSGHFSADERCSVIEATFSVPTSRRISQVVERRARIIAANHQVLQALPHAPMSSADTARWLLGRVLRRPMRAGDALVYVVVQVAARWTARAYLARGHVPWNGDARVAL
jgi:glycosyltransferase involved in cell wall biosynthesis